MVPRVLLMLASAAAATAATGAAATNATSATCPAGQEWAAPAARCARCPREMTKPAAGNTSCFACPALCGVGSGFGFGCNATHVPPCEPCVRGATFNPIIGKACRPCSKVCLASSSQFQLAACRPDRDALCRTCTACAPAQYAGRACTARLDAACVDTFKIGVAELLFSDGVIAAMHSNGEALLEQAIVAAVGEALGIGGRHDVVRIANTTVLRLTAGVVKFGFSMLPPAEEWDHYGVVLGSTLEYNSTALGTRWPIHPERAHDNTVAAVAQRVAVVVGKTLFMENVGVSVAVGEPTLGPDAVSVKVNVTASGLSTPRLLEVMRLLTAGDTLLASLQAHSPDIFNSVTSLAWRMGTAAVRPTGAALLASLGRAVANGSLAVSVDTDAFGVLESKPKTFNLLKVYVAPLRANTTTAGTPLGSGGGGGGHLGGLVWWIWLLVFTSIVLMVGACAVACHRRRVRKLHEADFIASRPRAVLNTPNMQIVVPGKEDNGFQMRESKTNTHLTPDVGGLLHFKKKSLSSAQQNEKMRKIMIKNLVQTRQQATAGHGQMIRVPGGAPPHARQAALQRAQRVGGAPAGMAQQQPQSPRARLPGGVGPHTPGIPGGHARRVAIHPAGPVTAADRMRRIAGAAPPPPAMLVGRNVDMAQANAIGLEQINRMHKIMQVRVCVSCRAYVSRCGCPPGRRRACTHVRARVHACVPVRLLGCSAARLSVGVSRRLACACPAAPICWFNGQACLTFALRLCFAYFVGAGQRKNERV